MKTINKLLLTGMLLSNLNSSPVYSNENVLYLNQIHKNDKILTIDKQKYNKNGGIIIWTFIGGILFGAAGGYCIGHPIGRIKGWDDCLQKYNIKKEEKN